MSGPLRAAAIAVGFLIPSVIVYVLLRSAWPPQHDLSDIATGVLQILLAFAAGVIGALVVGVLTRRN
jgi:hypothetical protein